MLLVMAYDTSGGSASSNRSRRVCPDGPINGSLLVYSESPGASPMNRTLTNGVFLGLWIKCVTLC